MELIYIYAIFYLLPKIFLDILQLKYIQKKMLGTPFILDEENFKKAGLYAIQEKKIEIISSVFGFLWLVVWMVFGFKLLENFLINLGLSWDSESGFFNALFASAFVVVFLVIQSLLELPFDSYKTLKLDKEFGFAKGGVKLFIIDTLKSLLMLIVIGSIVSFILAWLIKNVPMWWIFGFIFIAILMVGLNLLYPTLIAPIFNKFTPLENAELKEQIESLLQKVGFKSDGVFVMDASRRDGRLNAYFGGLGRSKRVILFDTLLQKVQPNELLAVLGHELGHFKHGDVYKMMVATLLLLALAFYLLGNLPQVVFMQLGISDIASATLVFFLLFGSMLTFWFMPLFGLLSRSNEYAADSFGAKLISAKDLYQALLVLVKENRSFPLTHPWYVAFYYTHPPLSQRLEALSKLVENNDN